MRVLVVEDEENISAHIAKVLSAFDPSMEIELAADGDDGWERYDHRGPYHLVITDQWHKGLKGIELIEAIRAKNSSQAIILQSGNFADLVEDFHAKYANIPVLEKPYRFQQLVELVNAAR